MYDFIAFTQFNLPIEVGQKIVRKLTSISPVADLKVLVISSCKLSRFHGKMHALITETYEAVFPLTAV